MDKDLMLRQARTYAWLAQILQSGHYLQRARDVLNLLKGRLNVQGRG